jgi:hypothetical protein
VQRFVNVGADSVTGTAAARYQQTEADYYADHPKFVPFIVEKGGRTGDSGRRFIDTLTGVVSAAGATPWCVPW